MQFLTMFMLFLCLLRFLIKNHNRFRNTLKPFFIDFTNNLQKRKKMRYFPKKGCESISKSSLFVNKNPSSLTLAKQIFSDFQVSKMPFLHLMTNMSKDKVTAETMNSLAQEMSVILGKDTKWINWVLDTDKLMSRVSHKN